MATIISLSTVTGIAPTIEDAKACSNTLEQQLPELVIGDRTLFGGAGVSVALSEKGDPVPVVLIGCVGDPLPPAAIALIRDLFHAHHLQPVCLSSDQIGQIIEQQLGMDQEVREAFGEVSGYRWEQDEGDESPIITIMDEDWTVN